MREAHPPAYLSPSRLATYDRCPELFRQRYVLKLPQEPSFKRDFGTAVHKGIEAHYHGLDHEMTFLQAWRMCQKECRAASMLVPSFLTERGLQLVDMACNLGIPGIPEERIGIIVAGINVPIIGYVDLWGEGTIVDWKTTAFRWGQARADREQFQPAIYSQAYAESHGGELPTFTYVVLPRNGGPVQQLDGSRSWRQIFAAFERAREIHELIEAQVFDCTCGKHEEESAA